jgi:hypothetical protein
MSLGLAVPAIFLGSCPFLGGHRLPAGWSLQLFEGESVALCRPTQLIFIPQGIAMGFYGVAAVLISIYLWLIVALDVGGGFNEFDKKHDQVRIVRHGFFGKNRHIEIKHPLEDVTAIRVDIKEGLNPKRALYLRIKGRSDIPLTRAGQPIPLIGPGESRS